jgi:hypothetical protein
MALSPEYAPNPGLLEGVINTIGLIGGLNFYLELIKRIFLPFGIGICVEAKYISKLAHSWRDTRMSLLICFGNHSEWMITTSKNPYLHSFPPSPGGLPPRKLQRREKEEKVLLPSYADPIKIRKYESIEAIFGERPEYVM